MKSTLFLKTQDLSELDETLSQHKQYPVWVKVNDVGTVICPSYAAWVNFLCSNDIKPGSTFMVGDSEPCSKPN
jgi:hypothetical protein